MKLSLLPIIFCCIWLVAMSSCQSNSDQTPTPEAGLLSGTVQLWDDKTSLQTDHSGVTISVDDIPSKSASTDANGRYSFSDLPYGLHDFTITKAGYGTYRLFGVSHNRQTGSTTIPSIAFGKLATTTVTSLSATGSTYNGKPGVSVQYTVSPTPSSTNRGIVRYFLSTDPAVSNTAYQYASSVLSVLNNPTTGGFTQDDLQLAGFKSGQTVYLRLYGESLQSNSYTDPNVGRAVYPNSNTTTVSAISFVIP